VEGKNKQTKHFLQKRMIPSFFSPRLLLIDHYVHTVEASSLPSRGLARAGGVCNQDPVSHIITLRRDGKKFWLLKLN
jgi:hypothetical protein